MAVPVLVPLLIVAAILIIAVSVRRRGAQTSTGMQTVLIVGLLLAVVAFLLYRFVGLR